MVITDRMFEHIVDIANKVILSAYHMNIKTENIKTYSLNKLNIRSLYYRHILDKYLQFNIVFTVLNIIITGIITCYIPFSWIFNIILLCVALICFNRYRVLYDNCCQICCVSRMDFIYWVCSTAIIFYIALFIEINSSIHIVFGGNIDLYSASLGYILLINIVYSLLVAILIEIAKLCSRIDKGRVIKVNNDNIKLYCNSGMIAEYGINNFIIVNKINDEKYYIAIYDCEFKVLYKCILIGMDCSIDYECNIIDSIEIGDTRIDLDNIGSYM